MPRAAHTQLILVATLVAVSGLAGCKKPTPPPAAPPAAPATPAPGPVAAGTDEIGNCYTSTTCTPAHNPAPGEGGMTQAQCKTTNPTGSWEKMSQGAIGITYGPCVTPP